MHTGGGCHSPWVGVVPGPWAGCSALLSLDLEPNTFHTLESNQERPGDLLVPVPLQEVKGTGPPGLRHMRV